MISSSACERNKRPICEVLRALLFDGQHVLEVGSGTGEHAVFFAGQFPHVSWQPSDTGEYLSVLRENLSLAAPDNVAAPVEIDVRITPWPVASCDVLFSANTLHFMSKECVRAFFHGAGGVLRDNGLLVVYGPFNYAGLYTSDSNAEFDGWLKTTDPARAIRDFEWVNELADEQGLALLQDVKMPANNRMLIWRTATNS
jgi:cyclopropane fatty-acyl-phospholipid synthase-like methyltransferase